MKKLSTVLLAGLALFVWMPTTASQTLTEMEYIRSGESALFAESRQGALQAHSVFMEAKDAFPGSPVVNAISPLRASWILG